MMGLHSHFCSPCIPPDKVRVGNVLYALHPDDPFGPHHVDRVSRR